MFLGTTVRTSHDSSRITISMVESVPSREPEDGYREASVAENLGSGVIRNEKGEGRSAPEAGGDCVSGCR